MKKLTFPLIASMMMSVFFIISCDTDVSSVKLDKDSIILGPGETTTLIATVLPEKAANKDVIWSSSNVFVASVMPNGLVTALGHGTTTIVVTTEDGNYSASCPVKVQDILVESVTLNKHSMLLLMGQRGTISATVLPENATNKEIYYSIYDSSIAKITNDGVIVPTTPGETVIAVRTVEGGKTDKCVLKVLDPQNFGANLK